MQRSLESAAKAVAWLRPGGLLLVNAPVGASECVEPDWLGVPMYFGAIGKDATITALTGAGLAVEQAHVVQEDEDGTTVQFLWVLGLKPA